MLSLVYIFFYIFCIHSFNCFAFMMKQSASRMDSVFFKPSLYNGALSNSTNLFLSDIGFNNAMVDDMIVSSLN